MVPKKIPPQEPYSNPPPNHLTSPLHPVVVVVHEGPANLGGVGNDLASGDVHAAQQLVEGGETGELLEGDGDFDVEFEDASGLVVDQNAGFVVLDDSPEALSLHSQLLGQLVHLAWDIEVFPSPGQLLLEELEASFEFGDLEDEEEKYALVFTIIHSIIDSFIK